MKIIKSVLQKLAARLSRIWEMATVVDYDFYLREREEKAARERNRMRAMFYGRGGWL